MYLSLRVRAAVAGNSPATAASVELLGLILLRGCWCKSGTDAPETERCKMDQKEKLRAFELVEICSLLSSGRPGDFCQFG